MGLLVVGVVAVSFAAPLIRLADAPPLVVAFYRNLLATALLLPPALLLRREELRSLNRRDTSALVVAGLLLAIHFSAWIPSVTLTTVAASTVLVATTPVWAAVGSRLLLGERVPGRATAGIAVAVLGAVIISGADVAISARAFAGDALALAGAISAAGYLLAGRRLRQRRSLLVYAVVVYAVCSAALLVAILITGTPLGGYPARSWLMFALLAVGPQILGHTIFNYLLGDVSATVIAVAVMGEPVGASILAFALFGESPSLIAAAGGVLILAGIYVAVSAQSRTAAEAPVE
ncbi:MAG TPA: DMT family transporter [Actinomycetota bacterium]|nr:DMT family transporter [Actinomycetota bacterium]